MSEAGTNELAGRHVVDTAWLEARLTTGGLRVLDATVVLDIDTWHANTGRERFEAGHVPGADFVDLIAELSNPAGDVGLPPRVRAYALPTPEAFAAAVGAHGVGDGTPVVTYDTVGGMWAARLWWLLRYFGHDAVAVLDGGLARWNAEHRPVERGAPASVPARRFTPRPRPALLATRDEVLNIVRGGGASLVNALSPAIFRGETQAALSRPGRIPGSVNVPFYELYREDGTLRAPDELRTVFAAAGVPLDGSRCITYCGGGIAASSDALALALLGVDAAVYDGSLVEWNSDPALPVEVG